MKVKGFAGFLLLIMVGLTTLSWAQTPNSQAGYNPNSVYPVPDYEVMYKKRIWRRMDLEEKFNRPFFSFNSQVTKFIIEAVDRGELTVYANDSLTREMDPKEFKKNLEIPNYDANTGGQGGFGNTGGENGGFGNTGGENGGFGNTGGENGGFGNTEGNNGGFGNANNSGFGNAEGAGNGAAANNGDGAAQTVDYFLPREVSVLEITEDLIFDKRHSQMKYDMQAITIVIPAKRFPETGLAKRVGTFKYKELEQVFRNNPETARWFNRQNSAGHLNYADAFALRLFQARITQISNPEDNTIADIYNKDPKEAVMASQWMEYQLVEFEHNLWSY